MAYCPNCGHYESDNSKFCSNCGFAMEKNGYSRRRQEFQGKVFKCPNCGSVLDAFAICCPTCGYEIRGAKVSESIAEFAKQLETAYSEHEKATIIRMFPIPNTKEDIWEFLILASSNVDQDLDGEISSAWQAKLEQVVQKANLVFTDSADLSKIEKKYQGIVKKLGRKRTINSARKMGSAATELVPALPRFIIIFSWLISIFVLIPQCRINLDSAGSNSMQLLLIILFIAGAVFVPLVLRCAETLPKLVAVAGIALSIAVLIPLLDDNVDNTGTNAFQMLLIIEIICIVVMMIRTFKYKKKDSMPSGSLNGMTFIVTVICLAILLLIYGIGTLAISGLIKPGDDVSSTVSEDTTSTDSRGIYTYEIRNYVGKNVASIGKVYDDKLIDEYGSGEVRIVFLTEDGMLISNDDEETKKQYVVVGQNLAAGTPITVVHLRDENGEPYSNLVDYQSYEELVLYTAPIGSSTYDTEITSILPAQDRHCFFIRDYSGRNAASFGEFRAENRVDIYGAGELRLTFTSEDGSYVDYLDLNELKKYIIIGQDISPNTELKLEYEIDENGREYDNLIRSQNYEEINLIVRKIDQSIVKKMPVFK